jgi:hypothetical protein
MEKLKDPAMILSLVNSGGIIASYYTLNKQIEALRTDMTQLTLVLNGLVKKIAEMERGEQNKTEVMQNINQQILTITDQVNDLSGNDLGAIEQDIREIADTLRDDGFDLDLPSENSGSFYSNRRYPPARHRSYRTAGREPIRESTNRDPPRTDRSRRNETRPEPRGGGNRRREPEERNDDFDAIIDGVRSQQNNDS